MKKLTGDYVAGFVDGEGCFALKFRRDVRHDRKNKPVYYYWSIEFAIVLKSDDIDILEAIKDTLGCGRISINKRGMARYSVSERSDLLNKIVPFFDEHKLRAKKRHDYELWKEALLVLEKNRQKREDGKKGFSRIEWSKSDLDKLISIQESMKDYKGGDVEWKWLSKSKVSQNL